jgi:RimJ/RimL family protein N-acetyltransferase
MSRLDPRTVRLTDGSVVRLRSPMEDDAQTLIDYLAVVREQTENLMVGPSDPLPTLEWERDWIRSHLDRPRSLQVMAEADGRMVGLSSVHADQRYRASHRGEIGISVLAAWCGRGLGTVLMRELIDWAGRCDGLDVLRLGVFADNPRAIRLYEKVGFARDGQRRWNARRGPGRYVDEIVMSLWVGQGDPPCSC